MRYAFALILILLVLFSSCNESVDDPGATTPVQAFDRKAMLIEWADDIIIPAYQSFAEKTTALRNAAEAFELERNEPNFVALRSSFEEARLAWQSVAMFDIGKAEELRLRINLNIYPTSTAGILENINSGTYNLELSSQNDRQGFPAIEYLLYGIGTNQSEILSQYQDDGTSEKMSAYLSELSLRIDSLAKLVVDDWTGGYRDVFVENDGNSATASIDRLVNDYLFYYEKALRAGKVGIPAGVFSNTPLPDHVEAYYQPSQSKALFLAALNATQFFFNGTHFDGSNGTGLFEYLNYLESTGNPLAKGLGDKINAQFEAVKSQASNVSDNFAGQVASDNVAMLRLYDELQKNVVNMKVDMLQALNVNVDYVDADGD